MKTFRMTGIAISGLLLCGATIANAGDQYTERQVAGRFDGEVNAVTASISRPISTAGLDLSRESDQRELRARIAQTATDLCAQLDARSPDSAANRKCVDVATQNALRDLKGASTRRAIASGHKPRSQS